MADELKDHLDAVHEAAERLVREATANIPPRGYAAPAAESEERNPFGTPELQALAALAGLARSAVPPELTHQLKEALRELLLAVRALIDWYLERIERRQGDEVEVHDIPIE